MGTGQVVGYIRVSSTLQNTERQLDGVDVERTFEDKVSGKDTDRPALQEMLAYVRRGDTVKVHSLDRLARNLDDLRSLVFGMADKGVTVTFVKEGLTFAPGDSNPMAKMMLSVMGAFAEFERSIIRERQREGIAIARQKNTYKGRVKVLDADKVVAVKERIAAGVSKAKVAREFGISRPTLYAYLSDTS
ncbi:MAG: putative resolvase [Edaphobacter sp.]|nr:putative resolvase [Edaphobacter sp.]